MLVLCQGVGRHRILGTTLDDSAGECFDKIARMAGITAIPGKGVCSDTRKEDFSGV